MLRYAIIFFVLSLVAGAFGLTNISGMAKRISMVLFALFFIGFLILLIWPPALSGDKYGIAGLQHDVLLQPLAIGDVAIRKGRCCLRRTLAAQYLDFVQFGEWRRAAGHAQCLNYIDIAIDRKFAWPVDLADDIYLAAAGFKDRNADDRVGDIACDL